MSAMVNVILGSSVIAGAVLCWLAFESYRRWNEPGATVFGVFLFLWGVVPFLAWATAGLPDALTELLFMLPWCLGTIGWVLFALRYTGTYTRRNHLLVVGLAAPTLFLFFWQFDLPGEELTTLMEAFGILSLSFYSGLALVGVLLIVRVILRYEHLRARSGWAVIVAGATPSLAFTVFGNLVDEGEITSLAAGIFTGSFVLVAVTAGLALFRYDLFDPAPAAGTIGERAVGRETDDLIAVVDTQDRLLWLNEPAQNTLNGVSSGPPERSLADVIGHSSEELAGTATVEMATADGTRQFDPQVSKLSDQHDRRLGTIISLRDVTDREIRKQRLEVLNRILRHNLRNQTSVIEANTEVVVDELDDEELLEHLETTMASAKSLTELGGKAKHIEELLGEESTRREEIDARELLEEIADESRSRWPSATVQVSTTGPTTIETDPRHLRLVVENLVENAIEHATDAATVELVARPANDPYSIQVDVIDDGPGIPDSEVAVIERGTETPLEHGSGIGLWVSNWAVREIGGELSFHEPDGGSGTVVRVRL